MRTPSLASVLGIWMAGCLPVERGSEPTQVPSRAHFEQLEVPDHNPAIVSVPKAGDDPRPLLLAAHGAWDRAEGHCELWQAIVGERAFVLCPQGRRTDRRVPHEHAAYYYPDHHALDEEVRAAISALAARYPARVDTTRAVYTGFSQGAIHGARVIVLDPDQFPRAALIEGGNGFFSEWSRQSARRYRKGSGERVLFGCGSPACVRTAERCAGFLRDAEVTARVMHAEGAGHSYGPAMQAELARNFEWLVEGDQRWAR
jgi:predicted esterase